MGRPPGCNCRCAVPTKKRIDNEYCVRGYSNGFANLSYARIADCAKRTTGSDGTLSPASMTMDEDGNCYVGGLGNINMTGTSAPYDESDMQTYTRRYPITKFDSRGRLLKNWNPQRLNSGASNMSVRAMNWHNGELCIVCTGISNLVSYYTGQSRYVFFVDGDFNYLREFATTAANDPWQVSLVSRVERVGDLCLVFLNNQVRFPSASTGALLFDSIGVTTGATPGWEVVGGFPQIIMLASAGLSDTTIRCVRSDNDGAATIWNARMLRPTGATGPTRITAIGGNKYILETNGRWYWCIRIDPNITETIGGIEVSYSEVVWSKEKPGVVFSFSPTAAPVYDASSNRYYSANSSSGLSTSPDGPFPQFLWEINAGNGEIVSRSYYHTNYYPVIPAPHLLACNASRNVAVAGVRVDSRWEGYLNENGQVVFPGI